MKSIENLLLAEFEEQHSNIRQIEHLTFQKVQFFFSLESLLIGGILSIASALSSIPGLLRVLFAIFWFLSLFGHLVYVTSIQSMINMIKLDFSNALVRLYFGVSSPDRDYVLFLPQIGDLLERTLGTWERHRDNSVLLAKFVGTVNAVNLTLATGFSLYSVTSLIYPRRFQSVTDL